MPDLVGFGGRGETTDVKAIVAQVPLHAIFGAVSASAN